MSIVEMVFAELKSAPERSPDDDDHATVTTSPRAIYATSHITGEFVLRSGVASNEYFDKYRFEADPALLRDIARRARAARARRHRGARRASSSAACPIATVLSQLTGIPAHFVRKEAKTYGTCQLAEGGDDRGQAPDRGRGRRDVGRPGGASSCGDLRERGAIVRARAVRHRPRVGRPGRRSPTSAWSSAPSSP